MDQENPQSGQETDTLTDTESPDQEIGVSDRESEGTEISDRESEGTESSDQEIPDHTRVLLLQQLITAEVQEANNRPDELQVYRRRKRLKRGTLFLDLH